MWQTSQTFCAQPTLLTQVRADPAIKECISQGGFNSQMLWIIRGLAQTLAPSVNPATELEPRPVFMREMEEECVEGGAKDKLAEFIRDRTVPCERKAAMRCATVRRDLCVAVCLLRQMHDRDGAII